MRQARQGRPRRPQGLDEEPVDPEAHPQVPLARLDVDVGRAVLQGPGEQHLEEALVGLLRVARPVLRRRGPGLDVGTVRAVDRGEHVGPGRHHRLDLAPGQRTQVGDRSGVRRVGHGHEQPAVLGAQRQRGEAAAHRLRHQRDQLGVDGVGAEVDEAQADLLGERGDELALGEHAEVDEHPAQAAPEAALLLHGDLQLLGREQPALEQDVAELLHAGLPEGCGRTGSPSAGGPRS